MLGELYLTDMLSNIAWGCDPHLFPSALPSESLNAQWRNYHTSYGFPPSDQIPEWERCPQEKAALVGGCLGEGIPSPLGERGERRAGREAGCPGAPGLAREGARPGNKGGRWRTGSRERD